MTQPLFAPVSDFAEQPASRPSDKGGSQSIPVPTTSVDLVIESWASLNYPKPTSSPSSSSVEDGNKSLDTLSNNAIISIAFVIAGAVLVPVVVFALRRRFVRTTYPNQVTSGTWNRLDDEDSGGSAFSAR